MISKLLLVAGGTGGHIFPAIALGQWLREKCPDVEVRFMCGTREIEQQIYRALDVEPFVLAVEGSPLGKKDLGSFMSRTAAILPAFLKVHGFLKSWRPDLCMLFGGYISMVPMMASDMLKIPLIFHEQNSRAGKMTRYGYWRRKPVLSGWDDCSPLKRNSFSPVGIPVRKLKRLQDQEAWNILHIGSPYPEGPIVVVIGGSLGSHDLLRSVRYLAEMEDFRNWTFLVLAEEGDYLYPLPGNLKFVGKQWDMSPLFTLADGAVTRAGASTLAELGTYGVPSVVVPWGNASESHQLLNAEAFLRNFKGELWVEGINPLDSLATKLKKVVTWKRHFPDHQSFLEKKQDIICNTIWEEMLVHAGRESL